jgi:hypothetical protein
MAWQVAGTGDWGGGGTRGLNRGSVGVGGGFYSGETDKAAAAASLSPIGVASPLLPVPEATPPPARRRTVLVCACLLPLLAGRPVSCGRGGPVHVLQCRRRRGVGAWRLGPLACESECEVGVSRLRSKRERGGGAVASAFCRLQRGFGCRGGGSSSCMQRQSDDARPEHCFREYHCLFDSPISLHLFLSE